MQTRKLVGVKRLERQNRTRLELDCKHVVFANGLLFDTMVGTEYACEQCPDKKPVTPLTAEQLYAALDACPHCRALRVMLQQLGEPT